MTDQTNRTKKRLPNVLAYAVSPKMILLFAALSNFIWYFAQSSVVQHWGSDSITFCVVCAWYWDWSLTNPPSLLLAAAICLLIGKWKGTLAALLLSLYVVAEGIIWVSGGSGILRGIESRIEAISDNNLLPFWMAPDWQYLFGLVVLATASIYMIRAIRNVPRWH